MTTETIDAIGKQYKAKATIHSQGGSKTTVSAVFKTRSEAEHQAEQWRNLHNCLTQVGPK